MAVSAKEALDLHFYFYRTRLQNSKTSSHLDPTLPVYFLMSIWPHLLTESSIFIYTEHAEFNDAIRKKAVLVLTEQWRVFLAFILIFPEFSKTSSLDTSANTWPCNSTKGSIFIGRMRRFQCCRAKECSVNTNGVNLFRLFLKFEFR